MKNCIFLYHINPIGGIETFLFEMAKIYQDWDITIYYNTGDKDQINRLKQYVRVKQYKGETIECEKAIFNYYLFGLDTIKAKEIIQVIHADYKEINLKPKIDPRVTKYIAVSKQVAKVFEELTGIKCEVIYNPITVEKPKRVLNLISATRLSNEKGKDRMIKLAKLFDENKIPFLWHVFTNSETAFDNPNVICMKPRMDIRDYIANADYTIQLSDTEGYCYTINESLSLGTPVIVTPCPSFYEMGIKNNENGFILDFDMKNVNIKDIYEKTLKFNYEPKENKWDKILVKGKSTYKEDMKKLVKVKCKANYFDLELKKNITTNDDPYKVTLLRAEYLEDLNLVKIL